MRIKARDKCLPLVELSLVILLAFQLAGLTWSGFDVFNQSKQPLNLTTQNKPELKTVNAFEQHSVSFAEFHLFGKPAPTTSAAKAVQDIQSIPRSKLKARVTGILYHPDPSQSLAIIQSNGRDLSYRINEKLGSSNATVTQIHPDRVIVTNQGQQEALLLYPNASEIRAPNIKADIEDTRRQLQSNPKSLLDLVSITPVRKDGVTTGYRVNAKSKPELFKALGFKANDLVVAINGYDLTDSQQAIQTLRSLPDAKQVVLTVERDGQLQNIEVIL